MILLLLILLLAALTYPAYWVIDRLGLYGFLMVVGLWILLVELWPS